ncbi:tyrosine-type recombinase/integrase [Tautonia plasticadhaerens]|uniref:Tyrosine recombinase XerD n=1 Tax=Tautonia plasticadhaerens TaxID=2527974 RepID=A0A518H1D2_9BACT|nr:tyrosine-type recombinase/integrase [Tautonia plasticadhaerens]QDV34655.1 Tyrosine recombinase XerD [Tautonia plasticadhaerens]
MTIRGKRHRLASGAEGSDKAKNEFHRLMAAEGLAPAESNRRGLKVCDVFNLFLAETDRRVGRGERSRHTLDGYVRFLKSAAKEFGQLDVADLKPFHVSRWVDATDRDWGPTTRFNAITAVKAALSWASEAGRIGADPLAKLKRPKPKRREAIPSDDQVRAMLGAIRDRAFRDLVELIHDTGARPGELIRAEAADVVEQGVPVAIALLHHKTAAKTDRPRKIYLNDRAAAIVARLMEEHPAGPLLLNMRGNPWTRNAMACRFARLREKLGGGPEFTAYALRHKWVTDHLSGGTPLATVSELAGHADTTMVSRVYSKLSERSSHLQDAARGLKRDDHG